ncbi:MAG: hypothetical protein WBV82_31750 [Myxococcaceae bacterium]
MTDKLKTLLHYGAISLGLSVGAVLLAALWPAPPGVRLTAVAGVVASAVTGFISLALKSRARTVNEGLLALVVMFGMRAMVAGVGVTLAMRGSGGAIPFVAGFFGSYFPLQWVEIRYLVVALKGERGET